MVLLRLMERLRVGFRGQVGYMFVLDSFKAGEKISDLKGLVSAEKDRHSIQVGPERHLGPILDDKGNPDTTQCPWMFMNHSCSPNTRVEGTALIALKDVKAGDELTFDYDANEYELAESFLCRCGSDCCRGWIRGYKHLSPDQKLKVGFLSPHLVNL